MSIMPWREEHWYPRTRRREQVTEYHYEEAQRLAQFAPNWLRQERFRGESTFDTAVRVLETRRRSEALLQRHLTRLQLSQLARWGWFEVVGKVRWGRKHVFRVHEHGVIYEHTPNGKRRNFCIMALEPGLPDADWMLTVKLLIESDCKKFLATAHARGWYPDYS